LKKIGSIDESHATYSEATLRDIGYLREAIETLENDAKSDLKIALYGSAFFIAVSLIPLGHLPYASLLVSAIDLWYFLSWGNDQLRLAQYREILKEIEGRGGIEAKEERHANFPFERFLYHSTPVIIFALFVTSLVLDYFTIQSFFWRIAHFAVVIGSFVVVATIFVLGFRKRHNISSL